MKTLIAATLLSLFSMHAFAQEVMVRDDNNASQERQRFDQDRAREDKAVTDAKLVNVDARNQANADEASYMNATDIVNQAQNDPQTCPLVGCLDAVKAVASVIFYPKAKVDSDPQAVMVAKQLTSKMKSSFAAGWNKLLAVQQAFKAVGLEGQEGKVAEACGG